MTDAQAIDHLNTIINERESAVALKEVLKLAITAQERVGEAEKRVKDCDVQLIGLKAQVLTLADDYRKKKDVSEAEFETYRRALAASKVSLQTAHDEFKVQTTKKIDDLTTDLQSAQLQTTKANDACGEAYAKKRQADADLSAAVKKYEDYKASLK